MTGRTNTERILDAFLAPEADRLADRVIDAALEDIARTRQRRPWWPAWRFPSMSNLSPAARMVVIGAVLIAAIGGGAYLIGGGRGPATPTAPPSATTVPTAQPSPVATTVPEILDGVLPAGTYRLRPFASGTMTIDVTVPAGGWVGGPPSALGGPVGESNGPNGLAIGFLNAQTLHSDPCHWDRDGSGSAPQVGDIEVGPTVDDLVQALAASTTYESSTPVDATLGGFSGKRLELQLVPDPSGCDSYDGSGDQFFVFGGRDGSQYAQGGANTWQLTIVDVEGTRLVAILISYAETSGEHLSAAQGILDSVVITP